MRGVVLLLATPLLVLELARLDPDGVFVIATARPGVTRYRSAQELRQSLAAVRPVDARGGHRLGPQALGRAPGGLTRVGQPVSGRLGIRGAVRGFAALAGATVAGPGHRLRRARHRGPPRRAGEPGRLRLRGRLHVVRAAWSRTSGCRSTECARSRGNRSARARSRARCLALRLVSFAVVAVALVPLSAVLAPNAHARTFILILTVGYVPQVVGLDWVLRARGSFGAMAALTLAGQVVYGALVPFLVTDGYPGTKIYAWLNVAGFAVTFFGASAIAVRRYGLPTLRATCSASCGRGCAAARPSGSRSSWGCCSRV